VREFHCYVGVVVLFCCFACPWGDKPSQGTILKWYSTISAQIFIYIKTTDTYFGEEYDSFANLFPSYITGP